MAHGRVERLLAGQLVAMNKRLQLANELTTDEDSSSFYGGGRYVLPVYRRFVDSDLQKQTKEKIAGEKSGSAPSGAIAK